AAKARQRGAGGRGRRARLRALLRRLGYEPYQPTKRTVALRNCPFSALAQQAPDLVCTLNRNFLQGVLEGLGDSGQALLASCRPGDCCVVLEPAP
ncbi:MAG: transcriptional regulator, partial [Actinomycetota bacterium]|nr:transcriptional regulator [Actinomycetota bacterium]